MVVLTSTGVKKFSVAFHHVIEVLLGCFMIMSARKSKRHGRTTSENNFMDQNVSSWSFLKIGTHSGNLNLPLNLMRNQVVYLKKTPPLRQKSSKMKGGYFLAISTKILGSTCVFKSPERYVKYPKLRVKLPQMPLITFFSGSPFQRRCPRKLQRQRPRKFQRHRPRKLKSQTKDTIQANFILQATLVCK